MSKTVTSQPKEITIPEVLTVRDLADLLGVSPIQIIKILMNNGMLASINQQIDFDTASIVAAEFNVETRHPFPEVSVEEAEESELTPWQRLLAGESKEDLVPRPPVPG